VGCVVAALSRISSTLEGGGGSGNARPGRFAGVVTGRGTGSGVGPMVRRARCGGRLSWALAGTTRLGPREGEISFWKC
jgi:hypothetical protein